MTDPKYFHVSLSTRTDPQKPEFEFDLALEELGSRFIEPYLKGDPIVINGRTVRVDNLEQLRIGSTLLHSDQLNSDHRAKQRAQRHAYPVDPRGRLAPNILFELADDQTATYITRPPGSERETSTPSAEERAITANPTEVFVVHGRNGEARDAMFSFLRFIGLKPLEWSVAVQATGRPSPHTSEILDAALGRAQAIVVLFTPDDVAKLKKQFQGTGEPPHETNLTGQARPNVLFEAGMAMGRAENNTVLVELGELRPFSDNAGRNVIRLNNSTQRRQDLAYRLSLAGCPIDLEGTDWHTAGDFDAAIAEDPTEVEEPPEDTNHAPAHVELSEDARILLLGGANKEDRMIVVLRGGDGAVIRNGRKTIADAALAHPTAVAANLAIQNTIMPASC